MTPMDRIEDAILRVTDYVERAEGWMKKSKSLDVKETLAHKITLAQETLAIWRERRDAHRIR